jgi:hypothetical protein
MIARQGVDRWRSAAIQGFGVLAGILLAFSIDAAWDERGEREREVLYLAALAAELEVNTAIFEDFAEFLRGENADNTRGIVDIVSAEGPVTEAEINEMVYDVGPVRARVPERAALVDLMTSGGIAYIRDPSVRRMIAEYSQALDFYDEAMVSLDDLWDGSLYGYMEVHASLLDMLEGSGIPPYADAMSFSPDRQAFVGNRQFANLLVARGLRIGRASDSVARMLESMASLRNALRPAV